MNFTIKSALSFVIMLLFSVSLYSQSTVNGMVKDAETGETLIGVNILVKGTVSGTISDLDGSFSLKTSQEPPFSLIFSLVGYETVEAVVNSSSEDLTINMTTRTVISDEIVVSASRIEESIMQSPVTIEKLDLLAIKQATSADYYDDINKLKGIQSTQASLTFNSYNARGFSGHGNTRFVQLQDGMDNAAPLLNFPTGNIVGISELDIKDVEFIPGSSSALYGPNAFNGILLMNSKDPFAYQGLSAQFKSGYTVSDAGSNPVLGGSARYAKAFNDKFAFKLNFSFLDATDWTANNYTGQRSPGTLGDNVPTDPDFDGVNLYGDESLVPVAGGIKRTGWSEEDLLESQEAKSIKYDAALHYRLTENLEANVSYKFGTGSTVYQGSERYALRDFVQQFVKLELNAADWNVRAYRSMTDDGDSYNLTALGAFVNEGIFPSIYDRPFEVGGQTIPGVDIPGGWAVAANIASNFPGFGPAEAKAFADQGGFSTWTEEQKLGLAGSLASQLFGALPPELQVPAALQLINQASGNARPDPNSAEFQSLVKTVREGLFQAGGAGFIDDSNLNHVEANYNLSSLLSDAFGLQVGANVRQYDLFTMGTVFNEDPDGDGVFERIKINEYGGYMQLTKGLLEDRLKFTGSIRYDKNENFDGQVTPRVALVYSLDQTKNHNIRTSFQTGFRNPTTQGQYIYFPTTNILLGGTKENAERYGIFEGGAWSEDSYLAFLASGDEADLKTIYLDYVQPEKLSSYELGYKGTDGKNFFLDANVYYSIYTDFIQQDNVINKEDTEHKGQLIPAGTTFRPYFNAPVDINAYGFTTSAEYQLTNTWKLSGNYTFNDYSIDEANLPDGFEDFDPGFNTPTQKFNIGISNRKFMDDFGFGLNYRWQNEFFWFGSFGEGTIPSFSTLDGQISYRIPGYKTSIKLGASNLLQKEFITNYGGPNIGTYYHLTITYDQFSN